MASLLGICHNVRCSIHLKMCNGNRCWKLAFPKSSAHRRWNKITYLITKSFFLRVSGFTPVLASSFLHIDFTALTSDLLTGWAASLFVAVSNRQRPLCAVIIIGHLFVQLLHSVITALQFFVLSGGTREAENLKESRIKYWPCLPQSLSLPSKKPAFKHSDFAAFCTGFRIFGGD